MAEEQQKDVSVKTEICCSRYGFHEGGLRRCFFPYPTLPFTCLEVEPMPVTTATLQVSHWAVSGPRQVGIS